MLLELNTFMDKSSTYCVMPHMGMSVQNNADFCCCNANKYSWKNRQREVIHVYDSKDVTQSFQSHVRKIIAANLDHGKQHPSCQLCWDLEAVNNKSPRQIFNESFEHLTPLADQPRVLVIKPGNTCNFACRMCNPITSSSWYADGFELEKANLHSSSWYEKDPESETCSLTYNEYTKTFENIRNSFNRDNLEFWNMLKGWIENLSFIDIYGGEPFLIPAMFELLEHGVSIGAAKNVTVQLHTNASIYNEKYLQILSHYKLVKFSVSIDSSDPAQLEYIRHKANYATVIENTLHFRKFIQDRPNMTLWINNTITPLNVFYVDQTEQELNDMLDIPVGVNLVTTPEYDIRHLPQSVKNILIEKTKNKIVSQFLQSDIPGCDIEWPKFCRATDLLDQLRNQDFKAVFPDWWKLLEPHWVRS